MYKMPNKQCHLIIIIIIIIIIVGTLASCMWAAKIIVAPKGGMA